MSGNMWARLRELRDQTSIVIHRDRTQEALMCRGLSNWNGLTELGRMVCDAFTEGQESVK